MLKDWTKFEKCLLFSSVFLTVIVGLVFNSSIITVLCAVSGFITALLQAKGKVLGQLTGLLLIVLYSYISFENKFYGEVIIYLIIMFPMYIMSIISWLRHQSKKTNTVEVNNIKIKEWVIVSIVSVVAFIGIYFLLKLFNTSELFISSLSVIDSLFAVYLSIRRSKYSFYFYIVNDLILIVLWILPVINGNVVLLPMVVNPTINLINDIYGIYNWKKLEKVQGGN